jgi:hypothetical protein
VHVGIGAMLASSSFSVVASILAKSVLAARDLGF